MEIVAETHNKQIDFVKDFTLKCLGGIEVDVSKEMLSKKSNIFKKMIADSIKQKQNFILIPDIDNVTLNEVIYAGSEKNWSVEMAKNLLYIAEKYEIVDLKCKSHDHLMAMIDFNTVFEILEVADDFFLKNLEGKCLMFIIK